MCVLMPEPAQSGTNAIFKAKFYSKIVNCF